MNRNKLKSYAPEARRDFIQAVTDRAALYGLTAKTIEPMTEEGDVAIIAGRAFPKSIGAKRKKLAERVAKLGFEQTIEAMAYTWFNRLVAIRFMELHGYLEHGYRVLGGVGSGKWEVGSNKTTSHFPLPTSHSTPEVLSHAEHVDLPGLDREKVIRLKLDGTKEEELYRMLLIAQCNALHRAMPFLFESIDDETELLLPDHLLHSDSLIRKLVGEIPEEDWQEVEIIGWLYQFYISEKKDEVIGKVVQSEDIPAATQLFTPNWIVKYLVQNSLGRQWVATYPNSPLKGQMEYYIEPAEQTPDVQAQLDEITPASLNPEELTLLDPACGSGHILVEAYDLLKAIYQERGYRAKDIPRLILEKNLYGLEIDDRAAQLAAFALTMKARADDRNLFSPRPLAGEGPGVRAVVQPQVLSIQESKGLDAQEITEALNQPILNEEPPPSGELFEEIADEKSPLFSKKTMGVKGVVSQADVAQLIDLFEHGKTFGSLIQVPAALAEKLPAIAQRVKDVIAHGGMFEQAAVRSLQPLIAQGEILTRTCSAVVANPPYMGGKFFSSPLKGFVGDRYKGAKADLYACFIQRNLAFAVPNGFVGLITIPNWMFLSSFEKVRSSLLDHQTIDTFVHNGRGVFGSDFGSCSFVCRNAAIPAFRGSFLRLFDKQGSVASNEELRERFQSSSVCVASSDDFRRIPGSPIAYWLSPRKRQTFSDHPRLAASTPVRQGVATADDARFLRLWFEVDIGSVQFNSTGRPDASQSQKKWFPLVKGGPYRKWYGNHEHVVNWESDGAEIRSFVDANGKQRSRPQNVEYYFRTGITYSNVSISSPSFRTLEPGFIFSHVGQAMFPAECDRWHVLGFLNSKVATDLLGVLSPTTHFEVGHISALPLVEPESSEASLIEELVAEHKKDWDSSETAWDFGRIRVLGHNASTLKMAHEVAETETLTQLARVKKLEESNNRFFIEAYGLQDELSPEVPDDQITLYRPDREEDIQRLISYAIGCMMGRYSLDEPGLIYAHSGNQGFDPAKYEKFPADEDGIVPLTEFHWFEDDAAKRFEKFIATAWPGEVGSEGKVKSGKWEVRSEEENAADSPLSTSHSPLQENLKFVAESLGPKKGESPRETIRRYLAAGFYKHHLSLYKKRPIYWLFSSGKHRGFQALVYLHRYNEGTLSRMRTEYVIPLLGKIAARIDQLTDDIAGATSSQHRKRLEKEKSTLVKQLAEVQAYDEKLRHYADQRITLDLDDGVKVNYGKFGDLLAEVKAVTGKKPEA